MNWVNCIKRFIIKIACAIFNARFFIIIFTPYWLPADTTLDSVITIDSIASALDKEE